jgi:acyl-coenzyme A synthetase/AMP-(fatty) acid ligase
VAQPPTSNLSLPVLSMHSAALAHGNLVEAFLLWAERTPDAPAVIDRDEIFSYRRLHIAMLRAAASFSEAGWARGSVVGVALCNAPAALHLAAILGLARIGAVTLLLSPAEVLSGEAGRLLERHRGVGLLTDVRSPRGIGVPVVSAEGAWLDGGRSAPGEVPEAEGAVMPWLLHRTSGTTGSPKSFVQSHAASLWRHDSTPPSHRLQPGDRALSLVSLSFYTGIRFALRCLFDGATIVATPRGTELGQVPELVDRLRIGSLLATPGHIVPLVKGRASAKLSLPDLREFLLSTGEISENLLKLCRARLTRNVFNIYGANEVGIICVAPPCQLHLHPQTAGSALPGVDLEVVDDAGRPVPAGVAGEVRVRTPSMINSYLEGQEANAKSFKDGWFHPGDAATMNEDGLLFIKGRTDDMMNYGGVLVGPPEIEKVVLDFPGVAEAAAFGVPHENHGDVPFIAVVSAVDLKSEDLLSHCRERLGGKSPMAVVRVRTLPRNEMGKVLRRSLSAAALRQMENALALGFKAPGTTLVLRGDHGENARRSG